jgi:sulfur-carrier protein
LRKFWAFDELWGVPKVRFTPHLRRFFPKLEEGPVEGVTVAEVIRALDQKHPGLAAYLVDDRGSLRKHVNVFLREEPVRDRDRLSDGVAPSDEVFILQALSGG